MDFVTLRVAPLDNPIFTGRVESTGTFQAAPGSQTAPSVAVGEPNTGLSRPSAGLLMFTVGGTVVAQFLPTIAAFFAQINMTSNVIAGLGDPVNPTDALNMRTGDTRYLRTGAPLIGPNGTNSNVGLGLGEVTTGFWRSGNDMIVSLQGFSVAIFSGDGRSATINGPLSMSANVISDLADAAADTDALNLRTGDTRYLRSGGGPIIAPPGTAPTDVGLGVGDAATGFYRAGTSLAIAALGDVHMLFNANRTMQVHVAADHAGQRHQQPWRCDGGRPRAKPRRRRRPLPATRRRRRALPPRAGGGL